MKNDITQIVISAASTATAAGILWLANSARKIANRIRFEHRWLMATTAKNTEEIERILKVMEGSNP